MVHDGWKPYDRYFKTTNQQCRAHLLRRCKEMIEAAAKETAASGAVLDGVRERYAITEFLKSITRRFVDCLRLFDANRLYCPTR